MSRIYVASSWRNPDQPSIVSLLRVDGHEVYDFRHPEPGDNGFHWSEIDPEWTHWTAERYVAALDHPIAVAGYGKDFAAMEWADTFVLVLPCGRSAHLELGWATGAGKRTAILLAPDSDLHGGVPGHVTMAPDRQGWEPELMYKLADRVVPTTMGLLDWLDGH